jgi:hypothetical protein
MRHVGLRILIVTCALALPAAAAAQERPKLDPDSPAGVEYQLPLDRAREEAAGEAKGGPGEGKRAPLFGSGVTKPGSRSAGGGSGEAAGDDSPGEAPAKKMRATTASEGGSGASVPLIAAAVLIVGGALGLGLRRGMGRLGGP